MKKLLLTIFVLAFAASGFAQSGRIKLPTEEKSRPRPSVELPSIQLPVKTTPTPSPTPTAQKTNSGDDEGEVLRVESVLIPIPVSVTDASGRAVQSLKASDFELKVDGVVQEISEVSRSETPIRLALLFDNSGSVRIAREFEKKAALGFFRRVLRPGKDLAALYSFAGDIERAQKLTNNLSALSQAIELFPPPEGGTKLLDAVSEAAFYLDEHATDGRRVIVLITDGADNLSDYKLEEVVRHAQLANCQIYVVKTTDFENYQRTGSRSASANIWDLAAERRMQELAAQTGGAVYSPLDERELDAAFARIAAELAEQYILSYYPNDNKTDGRFRQIALRIPGKQNLTVRTRKGYYVPKL
ncbi:MAG: VWA domain-containing protein [Acidobacteriota bacterium]|nr:VWA domain-containing protein [Acidobacteriota bacterium]